MSVKTIPEQTVVVCDRCGEVCDKGLSGCRNRRNGKLVIESDLLDMLGDPVANGTRKFDLCDECLSKIEKAVDEAMTPPSFHFDFTPKYVSASHKVQLLESIIQDYRSANPNETAISFQTVLDILVKKYNIHTRTIGNFFKDQLVHYDTYGGNRKKFIKIR